MDNEHIKNTRSNLIRAMGLLIGRKDEASIKTIQHIEQAIVCLREIETIEKEKGQ